MYVESSLRPHKSPTPQRKVLIYKHADYDAIKKGLNDLSAQMDSSRNANILWTQFRDTITQLMRDHIPSKLVRGRRNKTPWIEQHIKVAIRRKAKAYKKMRKTMKDVDIKKYKQSKSNLQKLERQSYYNYINNLIEEEDENHHHTKQKRFWNYIKSLRKDNNGISPLKDKGRLFNTPKNKADILNRQYMSVFTHEN